MFEFRVSAFVLQTDLPSSGDYAFLVKSGFDNSIMLKFKLKLFCAVLCCAVVAAELENKMDILSQHLQEEMADVWDMAVVNYSEPLINTTYKSAVVFDYLAMELLYNCTPEIIDGFIEKQAYPEGRIHIIYFFSQIFMLLGSDDCDSATNCLSLHHAGYYLLH